MKPSIISITNKSKTKILFLAALITLLLGTCSFDTDTATISVTIGTAQADKAAVDIDQLRHVITFDGPSGVKTLEISGAGTAKTTVMPGFWLISAEGYIGETPYSLGATSVDVKAGQNTSVSIKMMLVLNGSSDWPLAPSGPVVPYVPPPPPSPTVAKPKLAAQPAAASALSANIDIQPMPPLASGQIIDYGINTIDSQPSTWQTSPNFTVTPGTINFIFARAAANGTDPEIISPSLKVAAPAYLDELPSGVTLTGNYKVTTTGARTNLIVSGTVNIYMDGGVNFSVTGTDSTGQAGGKAAILLPFGAELILHGSGTLNATGGNAGQGANGGSGSPAVLTGPVTTGSGGAGGAGGGGAGAGIGTDGGDGGNGGSGGSGFSGSIITVGNQGGNGSDGATSNPMGDLYVLDTVTVNANRGTLSGGTASGGAAPTSADITTGGFPATTAGHGGGGGGGYNGLQGDWGIGSGGGGGRGAGGGGSGGIYIGPPNETAHGYGGEGYDNGKRSFVTYPFNDPNSGQKGNAGTNNGGNGSDGAVYNDTNAYALVSISGSSGTFSSMTTYTIDYDLNDGSGIAYSQTKVDTKNVVLFYVPTRAGYFFTGWNTAADGSGVDYGTYWEYSTDANMTLYAQWE